MGTLLMACLLAVDAPQQDAWPMNQRNFDIPIRIDPARKTEIREMVLYVSTDQGKVWSKAAVATPEHSSFAYHATADGTYWFSICVVDQQGRQDPPDPINAPVGQKILVDTIRPEVRLTAERQGDDVFVRWEITDANVDLQSLKLTYRTADNPSGQWGAITVQPAGSGQTSFRPIGAGPVVVRLDVKDTAENAGFAQAESSAASTARTGYASTPERPTSDWTPTQSVSAVILRDGPQRPDVPGGSNWNNTSPANSGTGSGAQIVAASNGGQSPINPPLPVMPQRAPRGPLPTLQMTNSNRITLDYEVTRFGSSGVGKVDLYITRDEGRTWQTIGGEQNIAPPAPTELSGTAGSMRRSLTVEVPEDGIYGFNLVVKSGAGLGKPAPQSGDLPQMRVEVDRTVPAGKLFGLEPAQGRHDALILRWTATDKNLVANPITLQWAAQQAGPWETIGTPELPNTGQYVWQVPPGVPPQVFLRLVVRDSAGNTGIAETPKAELIDLTEPEVRIISVGNNGPR